MIKRLVVLVWAFVPLIAWADEPDLFLLNVYDEEKSVVGWVMSEKLDGVRGYWDGKQLLTRSGKKINAPDWFLANYPPFAIDGELWTKRGDFETISSIVATEVPDERWRNIGHYIFEVPNQPGGLLSRLQVLQDFLAEQSQNKTPIRVLAQTKIRSPKQVEQFLKMVTDDGGEGVVIRNPQALYKTGRSQDALKFKQHQDDECVIVGFNEGTGKYANMMGAVSCEWREGRVITIGSGFSDKQRANPPAIGSTITFKYYGLTKNGIPKFASFLRVRHNH